MNNRFDLRTESEFKKDIAEKTLVERKLFLQWIDLLEREQGSRPKFSDTGCGNHGEFIESAQVSTAADFNVEGFGPIEVKFAKPMLDKNFHLKVGQTKSYIAQGASVLMVIGVDEEVPRFTLLRPEALQEIVDTCPVTRWIGFGWKAAFVVLIEKFIWRDLK
jgi:hypothetical protein